MANNKYDNELLGYGVKSGIIDLSELEEKYKLDERKKYLEHHKKIHKKWTASNGKSCTYLPDENAPKHRRLIRRNTEDELDDVIVAYWKQRIENPTVEEVFNEWNDRRLKHKIIEDATHTRLKQDFNRFYGKMGKRKINSVSETEWEDFLNDCICEYNLTAKAFSNLKGLTKGFLKRAKKLKMIDFEVETFFLELDVSDNRFKKTIIEDDKEIFYDDEMEKIMEYIRENPEPKNIGIALMFVTGIRVGELVALKHEDFDGTTFLIKREETKFKDVETQKYVYRVADAPKTEAGRRRAYVPEDQKWILDKIRLMNPFGEYVFIRENGERMRTFDIRDRLYLICDRLGIPRRSPHKARKTYASILLENKIDEKTIIKQMGHTSIHCTETHYSRYRRRNDEAQEIFNNIPQFMVK